MILMALILGSACDDDDPPAQPAPAPPLASEGIDTGGQSKPIEGEPELATTGGEDVPVPSTLGGGGSTTGGGTTGF